MRPLIPYLMFNGNCREAMSFYKTCFGGDLELMTYGDAPDQNNCAQAKKDEVMHSSLRNGTFTLMASDWPDKGAKMGNSVQLNIDCESIEQIEKLFTLLRQEGKIVQELANTFWGARFGMLIDKFGMHWMLNCQLQQ